MARFLQIPLATALGLFLLGSAAPAQPLPANAKPADEKKKAEEEGIPIDSDVVFEACGRCHASDDKNRMSRISYRRTTPEGWQETIKRMVRLNDVSLTPEKAREVLKYLSNHLGLSPEEARPAAFEVEKRLIDYKYPDRDTEQTCIPCHSMGRVLAQRRTKPEWELLIAMHRGYYPLSDFQAFRRTGPRQTEPAADGRPPDNRHPMEKAVAHLSTAFPFKTPAWAAWSANMRPARLQGRWAVSGYQAGKGSVYGEMEIVPSAGGDDEFATRTRYVYARSGEAVSRSGKSIVYTGYQWRGRSFAGPGEAEPLREVLFVERDWQRMAGRFYTGAYDEIGLDIQLRRLGSEPLVQGVADRALKTGSSGRSVRIYGANLPASLTTGDVDFGRGVTVTRVVQSSPNEAVVELNVAADAPVGVRDLFVRGAASLTGAVVIYDKVDGLKVLPQAGMARVGGVVFPKQYQQFEAFAYHSGIDGKPNTADDLDLGPVPVSWRLEEYTATFGDDDLQFVGSIDQQGFFTPNVDGPNPKRRNNANNYGDVWVVAEYTPEGAAKSLRARAHLLVTVPLYMRWDQPEVAR